MATAPTRLAFALKTTIHRPFRAIVQAACALAAALCAPAAVYAQGYRSNPAYNSFRGPIPIRDARPYNLLFLQFTPETPDTLPQRKNRYDLQLDIINNTLIPDAHGGATVVEDNEYQRLRFTWRYGIDRDTELGAASSLEWRNGGVLDGIIKAYHHLLGLQANADDVPAGRDSYDLYRSRLQVFDSTGTPIVDQGNAFGLGETSVSLKRSLLPRARHGAAAIRAVIKIPTGNPTLLLGSGNIDAGLSLDGRYILGREIAVYANVGYAVLGHANRVPGPPANALETLIALEYRPNRRDSFIVQIDGNGQLARTGNSFADRSNVTATFGYQRVLDRRLVGFLSFSEGGHIHNFQLPSVSNIGPEFTLSTGLTWNP